MSEPRILIVEDEPDISELIRFHVEREGMSAQVVESGQVALDLVRAGPPDLLILDLMLPDLGGLEVCRRIRRDDRTRSLPILIVSANGEESDIVTGLELGADDYVTKPFSPRVLMARIRTILRRHTVEAGAPAPDGNCISIAGGALTIDSDRHVVSADGGEIRLTTTEFGLLRYLATRPGFVRTRDQIISAVHGDSVVLTRRTVDVHITAVRRKLGRLGALIETVRGVGYRLSEAMEEAAK